MNKKIEYKEYRFHTLDDKDYKEGLLRNTLTDTLAEIFGQSFYKTYELSSTGIRAKTEKTSYILERMFTGIEKIQFVGINNFNNPIFKSLAFNNFFGSTEKLFNLYTKEEEILKSINESDLVFFGNSFDAEPMGIKCDNLKIIKNSNAQESGKEAE